MKQITILFISFLFSNFTHATIFRCNNNPLCAGPNVYSTAQAAHDAAYAGDTIHLEPTTFGNYGSLGIYKKLTVISIGDFLGSSPGNQVGTDPSRVSEITIYNGADSCTISCYVENSIYINAVHTTIKRARASYIYTQGYGNTTIQQSWFGGLHSSNAPNLVVQNNFIWLGCNISGNYGGVVLNNIIRANAYYFGNCNFENSILSNNILWSDGSTYVFNNCTHSNNICDIASLTSVSGNVNNVDLSTVFLNWGAFNGDHYELNPSYPNQNLGMFAGATPYKIALQPAVPSIYMLNNAGVNIGNNLQIQVSTKSNN